MFKQLGLTLLEHSISWTQLLLNYVNVRKPQIVRSGRLCGYQNMLVYRTK